MMSGTAADALLHRDTMEAVGTGSCTRMITGLELPVPVKRGKKTGRNAYVTCHF